MATYTKEFLSGSTNGVGIVVQSSSGGTAGTACTIHAAPAGTTGKDEIWMWAYNSHTANLVLTIEWGTASNPRTITVPYRSGLIPVAPGLPVNNGITVQAFCGSAGKIIIDGFVNRIVE